MYEKLAPELRKEFDRRKNSPNIPSASDPKPSSGSKESKKKKKPGSTTEGYQTGDHTGTGVETDLNELRSGRFSGILSRKVASAKKIKDAFKEYREKKKKKDKDENLPGMPDAFNPTGGGGKYDKLVVREAKFDKVIGLTGNGGGGGGGRVYGGKFTFPEREPTGGNQPAQGQPTETKSSLLSKIGSAIAPAAFGAGAVVGAATSLISSMAGMHQQSLQSQDSSLDAMGGYVGGGGGLIKNAEYAQIGIARARILGGEGRDHISSNVVSDKNKLAIQYGLTQGIGGSQGSELFAKMNKYGGFRESSTELKKIMSDGIRSGFSGLRQSEFLSNISSVSENAYNSGMGLQSAEDISRTFSNIASSGIRDNRVNSVYQNLNDNVSKKGNFMNSVLLSEYTASGKSPLEAMSMAERGISDKQNANTLNGFMSSLGLEPETLGLLQNQLGITTATESYSMAKSGKNLFDLGKSTNISNEGEQAVEKVSSSEGQVFRSHANALDSMAATSEMFIKASQIQERVFDTIINTIGKMDSVVKKLEGYFK
ncbi:hypothetical protein CH380_19185 [Leptospira adleri]|uniref:Uncharacterized protein n=1 Tax=Leptospira adleri TaxID=2023186 RepID=A0A2M9YJC7_9LEPT|nr:hypothetical protein CH380_19185 [Leptospira adleri]PJZ61942.1 hypothetical protein CH376_10980 [Leptospira adleri]